MAVFFSMLLVIADCVTNAFKYNQQLIHDLGDHGS